MVSSVDHHILRRTCYDKSLLFVALLEITVYILSFIHHPARNDYVDLSSLAVYKLIPF